MNSIYVLMGVFILLQLYVLRDVFIKMREYLQKCFIVFVMLDFGFYIVLMWLKYEMFK